MVAGMRRPGRFLGSLGWLACMFLPTWLPAAEALPCGEGVEVRLSTPAAAQGRVVLVAVRSARPLRELRGAWSGQALRFWQEEAGSEQRALLGVDLEQPTGVFPLSLSAALEGGGRVSCSALLSVEEGLFALEELSVDPRFIELSPSDRERAEREERRLLEIFRGVTPERLWAGGFRLPLAGGEAEGNFGARRRLNDQPRSPHGGEDFSAPSGTRVEAAQRGRVALAEDLFFSGKTVVLDHGLGLYTFYAHLDSLGVQEGEIVEAGAVLGRVGATGRVTGPHLHWAARLNRARVNPRDLLSVLPE